MLFLLIFFVPKGNNKHRIAIDTADPVSLFHSMLSDFKFIYIRLVLHFFSKTTILLLEGKYPLLNCVFSNSLCHNSLSGVHARVSTYRTTDAGSLLLYIFVKFLCHHCATLDRVGPYIFIPPYNEFENFLRPHRL